MGTVLKHYPVAGVSIAGAVLLAETINERGDGT